MGVGKPSNRNRCCEVLFKNDLQSSTSQSPAGTGAGLGTGIRNRVGRLNSTSIKNTYDSNDASTPHKRPPPPPLAHHARYIT